MKKKLKDGEWEKLAEKNAKHSARIHMEDGNSAKIAEAFKDIHPAIALEFLFLHAEKARKEKKVKRASVILEAVALIDRKTGQETDIVMEQTNDGTTKKTRLFIRRYTPAEVFADPITVHDIEDYPEPKGY